MNKAWQNNQIRQIYQTLAMPTFRRLQYDIMIVVKFRILLYTMKTGMLLY